MRSVADDLRASTRARVLQLPVRERVQLALTLGDDDLALLRRLRARRATGRGPGAAKVSDR